MLKGIKKLFELKGLARLSETITAQSYKCERSRRWLGVKIGVVQMSMGWTVRENLKTIVSHVENMRALDALVFPELSLSGFHRNIK